MKRITLWLTATLSTVLVFAQSETVRLEAIPFPLRWDNSPVSFKQDGQVLTITAGEKSDMFRDPSATYNTDNAPKLMFRPDSNFVLTAAVAHDFASKWDGAALVVRSDSINWVKFCFERDYTGANRIVSVVTKNISDDCNSVSLKGKKVYLKMAKAGKTLTLYVSENGKKWLLVRHFQMELKPGFEAGFLAQSPDGPGCTAIFSEITYSSRKISDPYLGE